MRILATFNQKDNRQYQEEILYAGALVDFIRDYRYIYYGSNIFELVMYSGVSNTYDATADYIQVYEIPPFCIGKYISRTSSEIIKCECGKDKAKDLGKHSDWCKKAKASS